MDLGNLEIKELLKLQATVIDELKKRGVVRTRNNPVGDYTEWLVAKSLCLELADNSAAGYDAIDEKGARYQIKGRRITAENKSRQLSAIRNYEGNEFDYLVAIIFNEYYDIIEARLAPHEVVGSYAKYREHVNAHILHLKGPILDDPRVTDIAHKFGE